MFTNGIWTSTIINNTDCSFTNRTVDYDGGIIITYTYADGTVDGPTTFGEGDHSHDEEMVAALPIVELDRPIPVYEEGLIFEDGPECFDEEGNDICHPPPDEDEFIFDSSIYEEDMDDSFWDDFRMMKIWTVISLILKVVTMSKGILFLMMDSMNTGI